MKKAFITGVSSGFGLAMAKKLLEENYFVYGCSRTLPKQLKNHKNFKYHAIDLLDLRRINQNLDILFNSTSQKIDFVFLNAGIFGPPPDLANRVELADFQDVLNTNMTANKIILDYLINHDFSIDRCIISSSIAGVRLRAGTLSYSVSKAALNALIKIYALENPSIFFILIGLCNMDTKLGRTLIAENNIELFPDLQELSERVNDAGYVVKPNDRAEHVYNLLTSNNFKTKIESGNFFDIRKLINK